jgi:hypothetical protein
VHLGPTQQAFKFSPRTTIRGKGRKSVTLWQSFGDHIRNELVLLAPEGRFIPETLRRRYVDRNRFARRLSEAQRVRGSVYLADGAVQASQLTTDGRHMQGADYDSWHLLALDGNGEVQGCARYRHLTGNVGFDDLGVRESWLARCDQWGLSLRTAVESEIVRAKRRGMAFSEVGGWAIVPEKRCKAEALRIAMATYSLAQILGGCVGITTATERHRSSAILRRIGGRSLECGGTELPSYYDPQYRCRMEVLRFDSSSPDASCRIWVEQTSKRLAEVSVLVAREPDESHYAPPLQPMPAPWPSLPQLGWATQAGV